MDSLLTNLLSRPKETAREWSSYQKAIFTHLETNSDSLLVQAVAGSGKTTTLVEAIAHTPLRPAIFLAFNKAIASELSARISTATVKTLNALGHGIVTKAFRGSILSAYKSSDILRANVDYGTFQTFSRPFGRLIGLAKANALMNPTEEDFLSLADAYEIFVEDPERLAKLAATGFHDIVSDTSSFDFDDQLYFPYFHQLPSPYFSIVFVDEAQDLSPIQHLLIQSLNGRVVAVGDRAQAIYQFRGAMNNSMDELKATFSATELPLSISYRCPRVIVAHAQTLVPWIEPSPTAIEGEIISCSSPPPDTTMILCRANAPLFAEALRRLRNREPTRLLTSWADQLPRFLHQFRVVTAKELTLKISAWAEKERVIAAERGWHSRLASINDREDALIPFCSDFKLASEAIAALEKLFSATEGTILATIHKAKGLESPRVHILAPNLLDNERNLHYVAITRAQERLSYEEF